MNAPISLTEYAKLYPTRAQFSTMTQSGLLGVISVSVLRRPFFAAVRRARIRRLFAARRHWVALLCRAFSERPIYRSNI